MKKFLCLFLSLSILVGMFSGINVFAYTEEDYSAVYADNGKTQEEEYIYYTDLFYAYPYYLSSSEYFSTYDADINYVFDTVYNNYINSPQVIGTGLEHALDTITSPSDLVKEITDILGITDFNYNDALDAANQKFAAQLLNEPTLNSIQKAYGKTDSIIKRTGKIIELFDSIKLQNETNQIDLTCEFYLQQAFDKLWDEGILSNLSTDTVSRLWTEINDPTFKLKDYFKLASEEVDIVKSIVISLMMEDIRIDIINGIISTQSSDTILKQGMTRLKNQLSSGFISYFTNNYIKNKIADKICDTIGGLVVDAISGNEITIILKAVKFVAFDLLFDVPNYGDVLAYQVLKCYSNDLSVAIPQKANSFIDGPFISDRILEFEDLFSAYVAANKAAMIIIKDIASFNDSYAEVYDLFTEAVESGIENVVIEDGIKSTVMSSSLTTPEISEFLQQEILAGVTHITINNGIRTKRLSNKAMSYAAAMYDVIETSQSVIANFNLKYDNYNIFQEYINEIKEKILSIPYESREVLKDINYNVNSNILKVQSDNVEKNSLYVFNNSILGNIYVTGNINFTFPLEIHGNFYCSTSAKSNISIQRGTILKVDGNAEFCTQCPNWLYSGDSYLRINKSAQMVVGGDFLLYGSDALGHGHYANLYIDGSLLINKNFSTNYSAYRIYSTSDNGYLKIGQNANMCVWHYADKNFGQFSAGTLEIEGDYYADGSSLEYTEKSKVILSGKQEQSIKNLKTNNLIIKNTAGVKYLSNIYVNGLFDTCGNPINNNGYITIVNTNTYFLEGYDYKTIQWQSHINLKQSIKATIQAPGYNITIPENENVVIDGNINLSNATLQIDGEIFVTGNIDVSNNSSIINNGTAKIGSIYLATMNYYAGRNSITNNKNLEILNKFESSWDTYANTKSGYRIIQNINNDAILVIGGDFLAHTNDVCETLTKGTVRINGSCKQTIKNLKSPIIIIDNNSLDGVEFNTPISPSVLFDHMRNKFTLYNNGSGSTFVDYDGDGLKDNLDPYPTDPLDGQNDTDFMVKKANSSLCITGYVGNDKDIVIPDKIAGFRVTRIDSTFEGCDFESITIGTNVSSISTNTFHELSTLKNIYVAEGNVTYTSIDGVLYSNTGKTLQKYPRGRIDSTFVIPETVTSIAGNAFSYSSIESIRIPEGIKSLGFNAFSSCSNLKTIYYDAIHCTTTSIFSISPFSSKVENFVIGEEVEYLPSCLLNNATVSEIIIPASVTSIHEKAFYNFGQLTIKAYANSCAKYYAESNGYDFVAITCGNCKCNNWQIVTDSSCTEEGTKTGICDVCGAAIEGTVPTKDHNYVSVITAPSCTSDGYTTHTCSVCGYTITDSAVTALGHSFTNYVSNGDATCTADGTKTAKCDRCDVTDTVTDENTKLGHSFTNYVSNGNATCTADGTKTAKCDRCDVTDTVTEKNTKLGHSFTNYVSNGNATCTADGTKTAKCDRCDVTTTVTDEGSAKGHTIVIDKAVAPTCTETGLTEGKHCSVCNTVLVKQEVIPATGHNDNNSDEICDSCGEDLGPHTPSENCSCNCHKSGFAGFIYKIMRFFWKLFRINQTCACGQAHY